MASVDQTNGLEGQFIINSSIIGNDLSDNVFKFFFGQLVSEIENSK